MIDRRNFLKMGAAFAAAPPMSATTAETIHWDRELATMDGFGASAAFHMANNLRSYPEPARSEILDLLFSTEKGAGLSMVRNVVGDGGTWGTAQNGSTPSIEPAPGQWNWSGDEEQIWLMQEAKARGCSRFISTVWSPPAWMKTNNSVIKGRLSPDKYQAFAEYLSAYIRGYKQHHGIDIYAVSPANEPEITVEYSSCYWTAEEFHVFLRDALIPVFRRDRVRAKVILGEQSTWGETPVVASLADPLTASRVDIVGVHSYVENPAESFPPIPLRSGKLSSATEAGKPVWNTEVSDSSGPNLTGIDDGIYWAKLIHTHIVEDGVTAWFYWWAVSLSDNRGALIRLKPGDHSYVVPQRLFTVGNYSRFVRPGCMRLQVAPNPLPGVYMSAYKNPASRQLIVVVINETQQKAAYRLELSGPKLSACRSYCTSQIHRLVPSQQLTLANNRLDLQLDAASVTTFVVSE